MPETEPDAGAAPAGVRVQVTGAAVVVRVRAGRLEAGAIAAALIAALWGGGWLASLAGALRDLSANKLPNPAPEIAARALFAAVGVYCALLCLWAMLGHQRLVMRRGRLRLGSPWLLGLLARRYDLAQVRSFMTHDKDCSTKHDGCCCHYSTVDYSLAFDYSGHPVQLFPHLPRESKDWLRERLNKALEQTRGTDDTEY